MRLVRLLAAHDAPVVGQQSRVRRIVAGDTGKAIEHLFNTKGVPYEVEQLGGEQVDDLGLHVAAAARHVETEQIEQRQAATDRPADRAFERELVVLPIDDLERVDPLITGAGLGVQGVEPLLPLGYEMLVAVSSLACPRQRYPFRLGASLPSVLFLIIDLSRVKDPMRVDGGLTW